MKKIFTALFLLVLTIAVNAQDVYHTNGNEYKNVQNLKDLGDFYSFDHGGQSYTFPKHRIKRISQNGENIYELQDLKAVKEGEDLRSRKYIFLRNGQEIAKGEWVNAGQFMVTEGNPRDGDYKEYYDSGEVRRTFKFQFGSLNGICKVFYRSGKVEREGFLKNGREIGKSKLFYADGKLKGWSKYQNGLKNGPTELYYPNRSIKAKLSFKNGMPIGEQMMFYENGKPESKICYDEDGIKNGPFEFYYESGRLKQQGVFVNGMLHGNVTTFYESGKIKQRKVFENGRLIQQ